jgi:hypothetical protein
VSEVELQCFEVSVDSEPMWREPTCAFELEEGRRSSLTVYRASNDLPEPQNDYKSSFANLRALESGAEPSPSSSPS